VCYQFQELPAAVAPALITLLSSKTLAALVLLELFGEQTEHFRRQILLIYNKRRLN
jgi:hypothetical protein